MSNSVTRRLGGLPLTPARIGVLAIGVPLALSLIGFSSFDLVTELGQASYPVNYSFPVQNGQVVADIDGNITLQQVHLSTGRAELKGTAHYSLFRSTVTEEGGAVRYDCHFQLGNCSLNGTLQVPEKTAVSLSTAGGDLSVGNFTGKVKLNTDGGNVNVGGLNGDLQVSTSGGDVNVGTVHENGVLRLSTDGGNITGQTIYAPSVNAQTSGGDINLTYATPPAHLRITTDGGNVTLVLPHGTTHYLFDTTTDGGNVTNSIKSYPDAKNTIYVHTSGGDINISEAS